MRRTGYDRFALAANPFHDLASESVQETEVLHVTQEADEDFERIKQDVLDGLTKAFVLVSGPPGAGKTQRLRVTFKQAEAADTFAFYLNLGEYPPDPLTALAAGVAKAVAKRKVKAGPWLHVVKRLAKGKALAPETAGRGLAEALGALAPAYLLFNDLDAFAGEDRQVFLQVLLGLVSNMPAGVMVCLACQRDHVASFTQENEALASRLNRVVSIRGLTNKEAEILLAKRMAGKRLVEDLDPLFPFTPPAVAELNAAAGGAPRRLLQLADIVLDGAVKERAFQVGQEIVQTILTRAADAQVVPKARNPTVGGETVAALAANSTTPTGASELASAVHGAMDSHGLDARTNGHAVANGHNGQSKASPVVVTVANGRSSGDAAIRRALGSLRPQGIEDR